MAYETGSATGVNDLMAKIATFLVANGYTLDNYAAAGAGYRLNIHKDGMYFNFRSAIAEYVTEGGALTGIALSAATGYDPLNEGTNPVLAWKQQPGAPYYSAVSSMKLAVAACSITDSVPQYHFFANADGFVICIERASGYWEHLAGGQLTNFGTAQALDGFFFAGSCNGYSSGGPSQGLFTNNYSYPNSFIFYENSSFTQKWFATGVPSYTSPYSPMQQAWPPFPNYITSSDIYYLGYLQCVLNGLPSGIGNLTPLFPSFFGIAWLSSQDFIIGHFDSIRCSVITGHTPLEEVTIGSDTFIIFPATYVANTSRPFAIAVKKVV